MNVGSEEGNENSQLVSKSGNKKDRTKQFVEQEREFQ